MRTSGATADRATSTVQCGGATTYRFGDGYLRLSADHETFEARFRNIYRECIEHEALDDALPAVACDVRAGADPARITFDDPEPLDQCTIAAALLATEGYGESVPARTGWRTVRRLDDPARLDFQEGRIHAFGAAPWQSVVSTLAVHRVLRLQSSMLFFHAASVSIGGAGVLLFGAKEAGKTTLSLALADRGHAFLGDEVAAVRRLTLELLPFRRRLSIRRGPAARSVMLALERPDLPATIVSDGTIRYQLHADSLRLRRPPGPVPLCVAVVLRGRAEAPRLERFRPTLRDLHRFVPLESTTWLVGRPAIALRALAMASRVPCYALDVGPISQTVTLLETLAR